MKVSRIAPLLVALLVLALPGSADMRGVPASDGHPQATIEGTITHVGVPIASPGPIVTLLGGLVSFDAEGATVRFVDGREATTGSLAAGQRILALLDPEASPLKAKTVVILSDRENLVLTGKVEAVDTAAKTLKVLGLVVTVTERTVFGGPWDGAGQKALEDVLVGDLVLVEARADAGALVASKVMKLSSSEDSLRRIHGTVESVGTDSWTIATSDKKTVVVKVGPETTFTGEPKVGDTVDVLARRQSDGSLLAVLIAKYTPPPTQETQRFEGRVEAISATSWTIGPKAGDGPSRLFAVDAQTQIVGDPKVGDPVGVLARKQADGSWLALVIAKSGSPDHGRNEVAFDGVVKEIAAATPAGALWLVDTTRVLVTRATEVKGSPAVGDTVHVEGMRGPDGTVMAKKVEKV